MNADANREGFRILRREPALFLMELLWRWSFGLGLLALLFFAYARLRQAVILSDADDLAFNGQDPFALAAAAKDLLAQALPPLLKVLEPVLGATTALWIAATTIGRGIVTRILVRRFSADYTLPIAPDSPRWSSFAILNLARVLILLIPLIGYFGGESIAALVSGAEPNVLASALIVLASLAVASMLWSYVSWVLSLAPIFVVRDALSPLDAVAAAIAFIGRNRSRLTAIAIWNGTLRGVAAAVISIAGAFTAALRLALPPWASTTLLAFETLLYFVVSDIFLLARLAAYTSVALRELTLSQSLPAAPERSRGATR